MKFDLGQVVATNGVHSLMSENAMFNDFVHSCFERYCICDWGDTPEDDKECNDRAIEDGERILAGYCIPDDIDVGVHGDNKIWIITEWDRSVTTILFPSEY